MLSKAAARALFLGGTALCSAVFAGLTFDTFRQMPAQTHAAALTPAVVRGKRLWERNNCMGCHTLLGEGAYYAPDLTRVHTRRGDLFIRAMLRDPEAMYPGQRRMVKYDFSEAQIDDLVAFLGWIDRIDLNGYPPLPTIYMKDSPATRQQAEARPRLFGQLCVACHSVDGRGGQVGPALDGVAARWDAAYLARWLHDPNAVKPGTRMPKLGLNDAQVDELVAYLSTLKPKPATP